MLCPYLRSSSINQFESCQLKYALQYLFGFESKAGKKATMGTIYHKTMELRALYGMAKRGGKKTIVDDNFGELTIDQLADTQKMFEMSFDYYKKIEHWNKLTDEDREITREWINRTLTEWSHYDPAKLNVIRTEQFFDMEISEPWAKFTSKVGNKVYEGNLRIKGTVDTIIDHGNNIYEVLDYKTGSKRNCFITGKEKDIDYLQNDKQLLFYLYALKKIYPDKDFMLSLFFINAGGVFTVHAHDEHYIAAENMIKEMFKKISNTTNPTQLDPTNTDWRCRYCCEFSKIPGKYRGKTSCQFFKSEIDKRGLKATLDKYGNVEDSFVYKEGGGRK